MGKGGWKGKLSRSEVGFLEYLVQNHLWMFAIWLVPLSVVYDVFCYIRTRLNFLLSSGGDQREHEERVADVQRQVRKWRQEGSRKVMCTARPQWQTITLQKVTYKERMYQIK